VSAGWIADSVSPAVDGKRRGPADRGVSEAIMEDTVMMQWYDFLTNRFTVANSSHALRFHRLAAAMAKNIIPRIHMV
jgi:hypothetical protein